MDAMSVLAKVKEDMKGTVAKIEAASAGTNSDALGTVADIISSAKKDISTSIPGAQAKLDSISSDAKKALSTTITSADKIVSNVKASVSEVTTSNKQNATKDDTTTAVYEFILSRTNILDKSLPHITDFQYIAFIRDPIKKQGVLIDMEAMIPNATLDAIEVELSQKKFPEYELTCHQIKDIDKSNEADDNIKLKLYSSFVVIRVCERQKDKTTTDRTTAEGAIPCRIVLENPIAWQMSVNTGFNVVFTPYTKTDTNSSQNPELIALETIINNSFNPQIKTSQMSSFTDYMIKKYAGNSKNIKQIVLADKSTVNLHHYEQITIPPTIPEINVPEYINNTYKPFSTPSFWFFDSFNFGDYDKDSKPINGKIPIWAILINFFNCYKTFEKVDISKDANITTFTHRIDSQPFADTESILDRPNAVINFIKTNMTQTLKKLGTLPKTLMADNTSETQDSRMTSLRIYVPDDIKPAEQRIMDNIGIFREHIDKIELYETTNTTPIWLQFGKLYNLEKDPKTGINTNDYIHTPVYIANIFKRRQLKDATLECINKYAMLRLIKPKKETVSQSEPLPPKGFEPEPLSPK